MKVSTFTHHAAVTKRLLENRAACLIFRGNVDNNHVDT